jgi:hypothetical protein
MYLYRVLIFVLVFVTHVHTTYTHIPCMQTPKRSVRLLVEEGQLLERKSHRRLYRVLHIQL